MKKLPIYIILLVFIGFSCGEKWIEKPKDLISEKEMVNLLVDIHIANSMYTTRVAPAIDSLKLTNKEFYYSTLHSHNVSDTLFEKSLLYYTSYAKKYEKMYAKVLDELILMQQEYKIEGDEPIDIGNPPRH